MDSHQPNTQSGVRGAAGEIRALPKVLLHDHLDGGVRAATVADLAETVGHRLPCAGEELADWFFTAADSGSLERYLEAFRHTLAVLQTAEGLERVAREAVIDLAADGVVYAEQRWAPELHCRSGLSMGTAVAAVQSGLLLGMREAAAVGRPIAVNQILCAMRQADRWLAVAEVAVDSRDRGLGVVGFDLAGPEDGYPVDRYPQVWRLLAEANLPVTIHAGEAFGLDSIAQAVHLGQADRLGHGVRILDDVSRSASGQATLGPLANWVRDHQITLEVAPVSNLQTAAAGSTSIANHPITELKELDFAVTVNTDNRLMSRTSMTHEMALLVEHAGWTLADLRDVTVAAAWSAFIHHEERRALVEEVLEPAFAAAEATTGMGQSTIPS